MRCAEAAQVRLLLVGCSLALPAEALRLVKHGLRAWKQVLSTRSQVQCPQLSLPPLCDLGGRSASVLETIHEAGCWLLAAPRVELSDRLHMVGARSVQVVTEEAECAEVRPSQRLLMRFEGASDLPDPASRVAK